MPDGPPPTGPRYEDDFFAWTQYEAEVLRSIPVPDNRFDREHVAEEIENAAAALPEAGPYTLDQIVADDWYPDPPGEVT